MKNIRLIASDMDNTLLTSEGQLPPGLDERLAKLQKADIKFAIASGRPLYTLKALFPKAQEELILICDNGGMIAEGGKIIFDSEIPAENYQQMIRKTEEHAGPAVAIICGVDSAYVGAGHDEHLDYLQTFYKDMTIVPDLHQVTAVADKFTIYFPENNAREAYDHWVADTFGQNYSVTVTDRMWIDIMNKGVDKGAALRFIGEKYQIPTAQMMAFGDTYNDIEMLETVAHSYLMANAAPDMKPYAKYAAPSNDEYGVLQVIDQVLAAQAGRSIQP